MIDPRNDRVLITGAAGAIGTALRNGLRTEWRHLRLTDAKPITDPTATMRPLRARIIGRTTARAMRVNEK